MKKLFTGLLLLFSAMTFAQQANTKIVAKRIIATNSLEVGTRAITAIKNDSTLLDSATLLTAKAVKDYVLARSVIGGTLLFDLPLENTSGTVSIVMADDNNDGYLPAAWYTSFRKKWGPAGNLATTGDWFGTTNAEPIIFKTNSLEIGRLSADGFYKVQFGYKGAMAGATGNYSSAPGGYEPIASGIYSFAAGGFQTAATGLAAAAFNRNTIASGNYSFAAGSSSVASGTYSAAFNNALVNGTGAFGCGMYNDTTSDASNPKIFFVGNGAGTGDRHNGFTILSGGNIGGYNIVNPTAKFHIPAPTATASTGQIKLNPGVKQTTPEDGVINYDTTGSNRNLLFDVGSVHYTIAKTLTGTATLNFGSTAAGTSTDLTVTVTGAADGDAVTIGVPNASTLSNGSFTAWVSATNTVTVRFSNNDLSSALDPASGSFRISVIKY